MLSLQTDIEGKQAYFGHMQSMFKQLGYDFGSGWDYHTGKFDSILCREEGETIYIRVPFDVIDGELDRANAYIQFRRPYVIKHVVNLGLDNDENSLLSVTGFNQFQPPLDTDGHIKDKSRWEEAGENEIKKIVDAMDFIHKK